jgi:hypothetical protein
MKLWVLSLVLVVETALLAVLLLLALPVIAVLVGLAVLARITRQAALRAAGDTI